MTTTASTASPAHFGKYQVIERLGSGGQAEVFLAVEPRLQRRVAIKVLLAHLAHDPETSSRFTQEARLIASLQGELGDWASQELQWVF